MTVGILAEEVVSLFPITLGPLSDTNLAVKGQLDAIRRYSSCYYMRI